jgi:hypothetical protein
MSKSHIFFLSSNIVEKISKSILKNIKNDEDVLFLVHDRYQTKLKPKKKLKEVYDIRIKSSYLFPLRWLKIKEGDRKIKDNVKYDFHLYLPYTHHFEVRLLMSHNMCSGFSIIEEGMTSYCKLEYANEKSGSKRESIKEKVSYLGRLGEKKFYRRGAERVFCVHREAFPWAENKNVLDIEFGKGKKTKNSTIECVLVLDNPGYYEERVMAYSSALVEALKLLGKKYSKIHYKLHPVTYGNWKGAVLRNLVDRFGPQALEIDRLASVEDLAANTGADVVVNRSSVGFYCALFTECDVYSFRDIYASIVSTEELKWSSCTPQVYWNHVQFLSDL